MKKAPRKLQVGTRVFYPPHGVVTVVAVEQRAFGASPQDFYVLELARGGRLLLPVDNTEQAGIRELVSATRARKLLKSLASAPATAARSSHRERAAEYTDGLRSGSPERYTEILQQLLQRSRSGKMSPSDQHALEIARGYFVGEIGAVLDRPKREIERVFEEMRCS